VHQERGNRTVWAIVPLKSPEAAKSRLAPALDASARRRLFFAMADRVVRTLTQTPGIAGVAVVTASPEVAALAQRRGALVIRQEADAGTAQACSSAVNILSGRAHSVLMVSGDIPLLSAQSLAELVEMGQRAKVVAIAPDRRCTGTNVLLCAPPQIIPNCFGSDSFQRHLSAARTREVPVHVIESEALALDIDDVADLDELRRRLQAQPALFSEELREALRQCEEVPAQ
jgi:2-phospho-L-lactate/phosphoenolpyruvate guanylyltransferase